MIQALRDYVVLEKITKENKVGSIYIATKNEEESDKAIVVNVGEGRLEQGKLIPNDVKIGDTVLFKKYTATEYEDEDKKKYFIVKNSDIIAVIK